MTQFSDEFVIWVILASLGAVALVLLLGLLRTIFRVETDGGGKPVAVKRTGGAGSSAESDSRFPDREPYTLDEFYEQFYAEYQFPRTVVLDVLTRFATAVRVPAAVLRPEDTLASLTAIQPVAGQEDEQPTGAVRPGVSNASYARLDGVHPDTEAFESLVVETASSIREAEERYHAQLFSGRLDSLDDFIRSTVLAHRLMDGK